MRYTVERDARIRRALTVANVDNIAAVRVGHRVTKEAAVAATLDY